MLFISLNGCASNWDFVVTLPFPYAGQGKFFYNRQRLIGSCWMVNAFFKNVCFLRLSCVSGRYMRSLPQP